MSLSYKYSTPDQIERSNVPKHHHGISLREVSALADAFKEPSADGEPEIGKVFCPRLESLVKSDLQRKEKHPNE